MRRAAVLCCALGVAISAMTVPGLVSPASAAPSCAPLAYQAALAGAAAALQQAPPDLATARADLEAAAATAPESGPVLAPLSADLGASPPDVADARLRLEVLSSALRYPPGSVCPLSATAARAALHDVYSSPDFRHLDDASGPSWLDRVLTFLRDLLGRAASGLGVIGSLLLALAVLGIAAFLLWRRWQGDAALRPARAEEPAAPGDDAGAEWRAAERAAASGDHREGVRRAFRAALLDVAASGSIRVDAAWTTRELLARCRAEGDLLAALAGAAALFDRAWYSVRPVTAADYALARDRCAAVRRLARGVRRVAP